jgi:hypothetical protein
VHEVDVIVQIAVDTLRQHRSGTTVRNVCRHQVGERGLGRSS